MTMKIDKKTMKITCIKLASCYELLIGDNQRVNCLGSLTGSKRESNQFRRENET